MGALTRLVLVVLLCGCTPVDCEIGRTITTESIEYVSLFSNPVEKRSREAAVRVISYDRDGNRVGGSGAYIVYKGRHYILTAAHVIEGSSTAIIEANREIIIGDVAFVDSYADVALISIAGMITKEPLRWRIAEHTNIGDEVIYSGYPNSMGLLTIKGNIAGYDGRGTIVHSYIWKGASGSVVLNRHGKIVGVVSAVSLGTDISGFPTIIEDVGFIVSVGAVEEFLKNR